VEEKTLQKASEDTLPVDPRKELALKLQRLNQRCLHQRKLDLKEPKQAVRESLTRTRENEERT
jgi:hypothetical protein